MVLQRWQSVFLFLAAIFIAILPFFSIMEFQTPTAVYDYSVLGLTMQGIPTTPNATANAQLAETVYSWGFIALNALIALFLIVTIFTYKTLKTQKKFCKIAIALIVCLCASIGIYSYFLVEGLQSESLNISGAVLLPVVALILIIMAHNRIGRDQKILSSYDRIR